MDEWWEFLQGLTEEETDALDRREFKGRYWRRAERYEAFGMRWIVNPYFALHVLWNVGRLPGTYYQQTAYLKHAFERYEKDPQSYEGIDAYVRDYTEFGRVIRMPLWNIHNLVIFMASHHSKACSTTRAYDDFPDTDENGEPWQRSPFDCIVTACTFFPTEVLAQTRRGYAARCGRRHRHFCPGKPVRALVLVHVIVLPQNHASGAPVSPPPLSLCPQTCSVSPPTASPACRR